MRKPNYYKKREHKPDFKYGRIDVARFINYLMCGGKKVLPSIFCMMPLMKLKNH